MRDFALALLIGFLLDLVIGDPEVNFHPVRLIGRYIAFAERKLRARFEDLRVAAVVLTASTVLFASARAGPPSGGWSVGFH